MTGEDAPLVQIVLHLDQMARFLDRVATALERIADAHADVAVAAELMENHLSKLHDEGLILRHEG